MTLVDVVHLDMLPDRQLICQYPSEDPIPEPGQAAQSMVYHWN